MLQADSEYARPLARPLSRPRKGWLRTAVLAAVGLLLAGTGPAVAVQIIPLSGRQVVSVDAAATFGPQTDSANDSLESLTTAAFFGSVMASAATNGSAGSAFASQSSEVTPTSIRGFGSSTGAAVHPGAGASADVDGETLYRLEFQVDLPSSFQIDLHLTVANDSASDTRASFTLFENGVGMLFDRDLSGNEDQVIFGAFSPGVVYGIEALAHTRLFSGSPGVTSAAGSSGFDFTLVLPEPTSALLVGLGILGLGLAGHRRA